MGDIEKCLSAVLSGTRRLPLRAGLQLGEVDHRYPGFSQLGLVRLDRRIDCPSLSTAPEIMREAARARSSGETQVVNFGGTGPIPDCLRFYISQICNQKKPAACKAGAG
jgi:hypothetical protein